MEERFFRRDTIRILMLLGLLAVFAPPAASAGPRTQARVAQQGQGVFTLEADQQKQVGKVFYADGNVEIVYANVRMRADHLEYNEETKTATASGHVQFDYETQHVEASDATYNLETGKGTFHNVSATVKAERRANPALLVSQNPLSFTAEEVERIDENTFEVRHASITVCRPDRPVWKFRAPRAVIQLQKSVELHNASFRLFSIPVIYLPYASAPAGRKLRQSGFLVPDAGHSTSKGYVLGDSFYWAPTDWADATIGAQYLSRRGWSQNGEIRIRPWENARLDASYYGVIDRGIPGPSGTVAEQGGHEAHLFFDALFPHGWRGVADLNQLSSLTFRLAFSETFAQAVNSEVTNAAFLTKNTNGFSVSIATQSYKNFLSTSPETNILLRTAPEIRASLADRAPWKGLPIYFGFDGFANAAHRETDVAPGFQTPSFVTRTELAPSVTIPLRWGPWLGITPSFTLRSTRYSGQVASGAFLNTPVVRTTEEFAVDVRPPAFERVWNGSAAEWKHVIEPQVQYRYVNGVNDFGRFLLFDDDDTLADTNEVEYGVTQRLYRREGAGDAQELASWDLKQKYYIDSTFGGALVPGQRNVFQALDSLTPFAFADSFHRFSPIISDLRIEPGGRYDTQLRADFDPRRGQLTAIGTLLKIRPYRESFLTVGQFSTVNIPQTSPANPGIVEPWSNQVRALIGYGSLNRPGWNSALGFSYDITQRLFQNQVVQLSYNGACCGIGFEYRRLALGSVRNENQFRVVFLIANIGSFGNLRRQEAIF
ncbi:MAG TPA: LPS assembly protein LptD [Candidatus Acidoferrales bacterium]|nr:LPS assembly protein LptD [Candidatus Acidoferrales bacterium]